VPPENINAMDKVAKEYGIIPNLREREIEKIKGKPAKTSQQPIIF
jgi:hypothetical protein